jgi:Immunity protein 22
MKHIVTIWGANFASEAELHSYVEIEYDEDGDALLSGFMEKIGLSWVDEDFLEIHFINKMEDREEFIDYLHKHYSSHSQFVKQLPPSLNESIRAYNSIILLYGNDSPYGSINDELFQFTESDSSTGLIASISYEM